MRGAVLERGGLPRALATAIAGALASILGGAEARADVIEFYDERPVEGRIVRETATEVVLEVEDGGRITFSRANIRRITRVPWTPRTKPAPVPAAPPPPAEPETPRVAPVAPTAAASPAPAAPAHATAVAAVVAQLREKPETAWVEDFLPLGPGAARATAEALKDRALPSEVRRAMASAVNSWPPDPALVPLLTELVSDPDPFVAEEAVYAIQSNGPAGTSAARALEAVVVSPTAAPTLRAAALAALHDVGDPGANTLAAAHLDEPVIPLHERALAILTGLDRSPLAPEAARSIAVCFRHREARVRVAACRVVEARQDLDPAPAVAAASGDSSPGVRAAALRTLGARRRAEDAAVVRASLRDPIPGVRREACHALAAFPADHDNVEALVNKLFDLDPSVVKSAATALATVTGESHGTSIRLWREWWTTTGKSRYGGGP